MRPLIINLLATALLLFGATSASAYQLYFDIGGTTIDPAVTSTVTADVILDVGPGEDGLELLSVAVISDTLTTYNGAASSNPTYILFSPFEGKGLPSVYLVPSQTPMQTWPGDLSPGVTEQVNVNFQEVNLGTTRATGNGILLATLSFNIDPSADGSLQLSLSEGGNTFRVSGMEIKDAVIGSGALGAGITITPEPAIASLGLAAIATIAGLRRWRRRA